MQRQHLPDTLLAKVTGQGVDRRRLPGPPRCKGQRPAGGDGAAGQTQEAGQERQGPADPGNALAPLALDRQVQTAGSTGAAFTPHHRAMNTASTALTCCMLSMETHSSMPWISEPLGP